MKVLNLRSPPAGLSRLADARLRLHVTGSHGGKIPDR